MGVEVTVALISAAVALVSALISVYAQLGLEKYKTKKQAEATLAKYREPLLYAAHELQSRFYNIDQQGFLQAYYLSDNDSKREYALENTLYVIAQYFGWTEILRREVQFLDLGEVKKTRKLAECQENINRLFGSDKLDNSLLIFRGEQRAIGECMIVNQDGNVSCRGYASFVTDKNDLQRWFVGLEKDVDDLARTSGRSYRLVELQHALIELLNLLDPDCMRFSEEKREKIPVVDQAKSAVLRQKQP